VSIADRQSNDHNLNSLLLLRFAELPAPRSGPRQRLP